MNPHSQQSNGETADVLRFGGYVGRNAAAVIDFAAPAGRKFPYERIGYLADRAVLLARGVIDSLDAAPRGM